MDRTSTIRIDEAGASYRQTVGAVSSHGVSQLICPSWMSYYAALAIRGERGLPWEADAGCSLTETPRLLAISLSTVIAVSTDD